MMRSKFKCHFNGARYCKQKENEMIIAVMAESVAYYFLLLPVQSQ